LSRRYITLQSLADKGYQAYISEKKNLGAFAGYSLQALARRASSLRGFPLLSGAQHTQVVPI